MMWMWSFRVHVLSPVGGGSPLQAIGQFSGNKGYQYCKTTLQTQQCTVLFLGLEKDWQNDPAAVLRVMN